MTCSRSTASRRRRRPASFWRRPAHFGMPVSTTHIVCGSVFGVGIAKRLNEVRWPTAQRMVTAWVLTLPGAALVAGLSFFVIQFTGSHARGCRDAIGRVSFGRGGKKAHERTGTFPAASRRTRFCKRSDMPFPCKAVCNPAACLMDGETLLLLRVIDTDDHSHLVVARSQDGIGGWQFQDAAACFRPAPMRPGTRRWAAKTRASPICRRRERICHRLCRLLPLRARASAWRRRGTSKASSGWAWSSIPTTKTRPCSRARSAGAICCCTGRRRGRWKTSGCRRARICGTGATRAASCRKKTSRAGTAAKWEPGRRRLRRRTAGC